MVERQVLAVRDCMLLIIFSHSDNPIVRHLAESALEGFVQVNTGNEAYAVVVDIPRVARMELSKCLDAAIKSRDVWIRSVSTDQVTEWGDDYLQVIAAYDELSRIKNKIFK